MLDFGAGELVVIGVVALVAIGPKELPGVLRAVGQVVGRMRRMAGDFQSQFNDAMREADLGDAQKLIADIKSDVSGVAASAEISATPAAATLSDTPDAGKPITDEAVFVGQVSTSPTTDSTPDQPAQQLTLISDDDAPAEESKPKRKRASKKAVSEEEPT